MLSVTASVKIGTKEFKSNNLSLHQTYNGHHSFELTIVRPLTEKMDLGVIDNFLGKEVRIEILPKVKGKSKEEQSGVYFIGFIDEIHPSWSSTSRMLRVRGYSKSMLLDSGPRFRSFVDMTLGKIVDEIKGSYSGGLSLPEINCSEDGSRLPFNFQMQETDYQFLSRIADKCDKILYFNGESMELKDWSSFEKAKVRVLSLGSQVSHIDFSINSSPLLFNLKAHNYEKAESFETSSNLKGASNELANRIVKSSKKTYATTNMITNQLVDKNGIKKEANRLLASQSHDLIRLHASTNQLSLKLGQKISITDAKDPAKNEMFEYGTFLITQVSHTVSSDGTYFNSISAIPEGFNLPIRMNNYRKPMTGPLVATVSNTEDPEKMGRVAVRFKNDQSKSAKDSPWLRVLHPYTGRGGWYFIPEVEDEVMVSHEGFGIGDQSFVMGSFYHGKSKVGEWQKEGNHKKGFATDKVKFEIDDDTGKLTITAEEVELIAKKEMKFNGGNQLTQKASRIDLN